MDDSGVWGADIHARSTETACCAQFPSALVRDTTSLQSGPNSSDQGLRVQESQATDSETPGIRRRREMIQKCPGSS